MLVSPITPPRRSSPTSLAIDTILSKDKTAVTTTIVSCPPSPPLSETDTRGLSDLLASSTDPITPETRPVVAVIGVGYVGTHLIEVFSSEYDTLGFDISEKRIQEVEQEFSANSRVDFTTEPRDLRAATHFLISVPTLLLPDKSIDSSYLRSAISTVTSNARPGSTIVVESSVAVGMTRDLLGPLAKSHQLFVGMSPERVDPGRVSPAAHEIPKVVSGLEDVAPGSLNSILRLYTRVFDRVIPVSRPEVAEMTKLYENCQRMMCIAYANEMAEACRSHGIDPYEVCDAAASKPFGYMPYSPGVGVGGHCIPINPFYLLSNNNFPLLQAATETMWRRPAMLAERCLEKAEKRTTCRSNKINKEANQTRPRILVVGVGFKPGQTTLSNSPGLEVAATLARSGRAEVMFADPMVQQESVPQLQRLPDEAWNEETLRLYDMVIVAMRQVGIDFGVLDQIREDVEVEFLCQ